MPAKGCTYRNNKVDVPEEIRKSTVSLSAELGSYLKASKVLGVAPTTVAELIALGGVLQPRVLAKVRAKLVELGKVA